MKKNIKIANGQGFWGDSIQAPIDLIDFAEIDYLTLDYLAEVTLSIMQRQKNKYSDRGYAKDFVDLIDNKIDDIYNNKIKVITNAGGVNPESCSYKLKEISTKAKKNLNIGIIEGDNIVDKIYEFMKNE